MEREKMWKFETVLGEKPEMSVDNKRDIAEWERRVVHWDDSHYELSTPFRDPSLQLPCNQSMADKRLDALGKRLKGDRNLWEKYTAFMEDLLVKGYAEPMDDCGKDGKVCYLPHHGIIQAEKQDKARIVFDCAAKFGDVSLNDCFMWSWSHK